MLSIIIPVLNEKKIIFQSLSHLRKTLAGYDIEVIVSDAGSDDGSDGVTKYDLGVAIEKAWQALSLTAGLTYTHRPGEHADYF